MVRRRYPFSIHALCLMTNHFHMLIETRDTSLSKIMQKFLSLYATDFNQRHGITGHLFESRYTACLVEDETYFMEVSRYIHLNPVRAQIVGAPEAYDYSSYRFFVNEEPKEEQGGAEQLLRELVETERTFGYFGEHSKEQYRMFVEEGA